ncbi:MAG: cupin-like domain-containing protein, partial [Bacteroidia bacterium]
MDLSQEIDVVENISTAEFNKYYFKPQKPVLIKGLAKGKEAERKWSIDYFKQTMGDVIVDVYDNQVKKSVKSTYTAPDLKMKFADYLDILSKNEQTDLRIFLFDLFKYNPQLKKEFPCPDLFKGLLDNIGHMFFGGKNTTVRIHYDIDMSNVLHTHFGGKKRVVLIAPQYSYLLYCLPLNTYSLIDSDKPDYKKYPGLKYVKGYDFILEAGDSLFMPSGYWHYMTYLEGSFSVSYRRLGPTIQYPLEGLLNMGFCLPLDKILNKVLSNK